MHCRFLLSFSFAVATMLLPSALAQSPAPQNPVPQNPAPQSAIPEVKEMQKTASGLEYGVIKPGSEQGAPTNDDVVEVHYTGWLLDGTKFDSSRDRGTPASFGVTQVIKGWTEGLKLMTPGARYKFVIPGDLAYGPAGRKPKIPENATLVFDVELLNVRRMPKLPEGHADKASKLDSGVTMEVLAEGAGEVPSAETGVKLRYALWKKTGELLDCTERNNNYHISGTLASLPLAPWFPEIVAKLKVGTRVRCEVPEKLYPNPKADTVWQLELVAVMLVPTFRKCDPKKQVTTDSGLIYEVVEQGTGAMPKASDTVVAHYSGWLLEDGKLFDSSFVRGEPSEFPLNGVIKGWTEGLQLMNVGGKYLFTIPAKLGYGEQGMPKTIPGNATLVFYVELIDIKK